MKVTIQKACKLRGKNWKKGATPSVTSDFAAELKAKGYLDAPKKKTDSDNNELTEE
jgi:hypothetical protein